MRALRCSSEGSLAGLVMLWLLMCSNGFSSTSPTLQNTMVHPSTLLTADSIIKLRSDLPKDSYRNSIYEGTVKSHAEDWATRTIRVPARAGYYHDFTCMDGTRLTWPESLRHCEAIPAGQEYVCPACGRKYCGEKFDGAVRCLQHNDLMAAARDLAFCGTIEQNSAYYEKAAEILRAYADVYPGRHTAPTKGGILYQSLDEAVHFIYLAQAYDLLVGAHILSQEDRDNICKRLLWECAEGLIHCGIGGNWGSWHLSAVGVIGFATDRQDYIDYGISNFKKQITEQLGNDGLWPESVHTYHFYPMRGFLQLAEAALPNGIDLYDWETGPGKGLRAMFIQPVQYAYPNLQLPAINDGWFQSYLPLDLYEVGYDRMRLPELGWIVNESRRLKTSAASGSPDALSIWSVIHGVQPDPAFPRPLLHTSNFNNIGICTLRLGLPAEKETMVTFDYGRMLGHGQADKMSITLFSGGKLLMADYGTPSYGSSILPYYKGTLAHNTVMIDGNNQAATKHANLLAFVDEPQLKVAVAETTEVAKGVRWRRAVLLNPDILVVSDCLDADSNHQFDSLMHCVGDELAPVGNNTFADSTTEALGLKILNDVKNGGEMDSLDSIQWKSSGLPVLTGSCASFPAANYFTAMCPAENDTKRIPMVVQRIRGRSARMLTVFALPGGRFAHERIHVAANHIMFAIDVSANPTMLEWKADRLLWTEGPAAGCGESVTRKIPFNSNNP